MNNHKNNFTVEIIIGIVACVIAVFIIVKSLEGTVGWNGFEQDTERAVVVATNFNGWVQGNGFVLAAANGNTAVPLNMAKPAAKASGKEFSKFGLSADMFLEGHWWGMEVENLTPLAREILKIPPGIEGLWVDETNLWAVRAGIKGADIILGINGYKLRNLGEFYQLTKRIKDRNRAVIEILRGDKRITVELAPGAELGVAAMESSDALDPMTSDAAVDPLNLTEEAPPDFPQKGYRTLVSPQ